MQTFSSFSTPLTLNPQSHPELLNSGIHPAFEGIAVEIAQDLELDPLTGEVLGTPIADALNQKYIRFGWQAKPNEQALIFHQESGEIWQIKQELGVLQASGRKGKYRAPAGIGNAIYTPPIPAPILQKICDRHGLDYPQTEAEIIAVGGFWAWVRLHPELRIIITEGAKKALSALSQGWIAIALYGCSCGASPQLAPFLKNRRVVAAYDSDSKPSARDAVRKGLGILASAVAQADGSLEIASWHPEQGKGIDDLIVQSGVEGFESAINSAQNICLYWARQAAKNPLGKYSPNLKVNLPCLSAIAPSSIPESGIVVIHAGLGTGKTKLITSLIAGSEAVIAPGHRVSLQSGLAERLGLDYLTNLDRTQGYLINKDGLPTKRVTLCWDSLLAVPLDLYPAGSYDLVLDEADQGLWHLLRGSTCGKRGLRPGLVDRAKSLIVGARRVILASGTLTSADIALIESLREERAWILQNAYQGNCYPITLYTNESGAKDSRKLARGSALSAFMTQLCKGDRLIVATDEKRSAQALELAAIQCGLDSKEILTITADTSSDPLQQDFLTASDKVGWLRDRGIRLLLHNSSMTSGVSI